MTINDLYTKVNNRLALAGRPQVSKEDFVVILSVMNGEGKVHIEGDQVGRARDRYQHIVNQLAAEDETGSS